MHRNGSDSTDITNNGFINRSDLVLILIIAIIGLCIVALISLTRKPGRAVRISLDGQEIGSYPLDQDVRLEIGPEGLKKTGTETAFSNVLEIREGAADMKEADCPDKICVDHKPVSKLGETIVCLPHKLVVEVVDPSGDRTGEDADVIAG